jgi:hypothetical protein
MKPFTTNEIDFLLSGKSYLGIEIKDVKVPKFSDLK